MANQILRLPDVIERVKLSRSSIYGLVAKGSFPPPIKLGERAIGWPDSVISDWIDSRIAESERDSGGKQ